MALRHFALALALALSACHTAPPPPDHPRTAPGVRMRDVSFHSIALDRDMVYRVYLPEQIPSGQRLPVIYLLHGGNGGFRDWSNDSDVAAYAHRGLILVMIEGAFSYYMNAAGRSRDRYEDYFAHDLITDVEARFPAATDRPNRAIIGISMGGFAALKLAFTRPDLFSFAAALSPPVDILHRRFSFRRWGEWWRIRTIFGPAGSETRRSSDPLLLVESATPGQTPYLYLTAGQSEPLLPPIRHFAASLGQRSIAYEFHTRPGGHAWDEWNRQLPGIFDALSRHGFGSPANTSAAGKGPTPQLVTTSPLRR